MIEFAKCWTGRRWINISRGLLAVGLGPRLPVERIVWRGNLIWFAGKGPAPSSLLLALFAAIIICVAAFAGSGRLPFIHGADVIHSPR